MNWRLFIGLILSTAFLIKGQAQVIMNDDFSGGISGWQFEESCNCGYELHLWETDPDEGLTAPSLTWQNNNICGCACENDVWCEGGQTCFGCAPCQGYTGYFYKTISFPDGVSAFTLSFDWRASSNLDWSNVTNSALRVTDESDELIIEEDLIMGGTFDTGWQYYEENFELECEYWNEITIYFDVIDHWWETPWCHKNWWDNVKVEAIEQNESPVLVESNSPVCFGETIVLSASEGESYEWSGPNGFLGNLAQIEIPNATSSDAGEYSVFIMDEFGCEHELIVTVEVEQLMSYFVDYELCEGQDFELPDGQVVSESGTYETLFENDDECDSLIVTSLEYLESFESYIDTVLCQNSDFHDSNGNVIEESGQYQFDYVSNQGCDSILYLNVSFDPIEVDTLVIQICPGDNFTTSGGALLNDEGEYLEFVASDIGCGDYTLYSVTWFPSPVAAFEFQPESGTSSNAEAVFQNTSEGVNNIFWNLYDLGIYFSDTITIGFGEEPGSYPICLIAENEFGCIDSTCVEFVVREDVNIFVPNVFTPNGDGVNDLFYVVGSGLDPADFQLLIFNRWGQLIFESNHIEQKWDGRNRSGTHYVSDGVYPYVLKVGLLDSPERIERTGHVTILR